MRVMVMVKGDPQPGQLPTEEQLEEMAKYNEELIKAGIMLDGAGLHPSAEGKRVRFGGGKRTVIDGPFAEAKEVVAGYWLLQVKSIDEAVEWAKRIPFDGGDESFPAEVEIRQLYELDEFGESPAIDHHRELQKELDQKK
ncbi:MAG TPA: YciI family protein [Actinomycetota bacterium]|nr:YciI family protein [Actinomycetota bacterium]